MSKLVGSVWAVKLYLKWIMSLLETRRKRKGYYLSAHIISEVTKTKKLLSEFHSFQMSNDFKNIADICSCAHAERRAIYPNLMS